MFYRGTLPGRRQRTDTVDSAVHTTTAADGGGGEKKNRRNQKVLIALCLSENPRSRHERGRRTRRARRPVVIDRVGKINARVVKVNDEAKKKNRTKLYENRTSDFVCKKKKKKPLVGIITITIKPDIDTRGPISDYDRGPDADADTAV